MTSHTLQFYDKLLSHTLFITYTFLYNYRIFYAKNSISTKKHYPTIMENKNSPFAIWTCNYMIWTKLYALISPFQKHIHFSLGLQKNFVSNRHGRGIFVNFQTVVGNQFGREVLSTLPKEYRSVPTIHFSCNHAANSPLGLSAMVASLNYFNNRCP